MSNRKMAAARASAARDPQAGRQSQSQGSPARPQRIDEFSFLNGTVLDGPTLASAAQRAAACGVPLHRFLLLDGVLDAASYANALAAHLDLPHVAQPAGEGFTIQAEPGSISEGWVTGRKDGEAWVVLDATLASPRSLGVIARRLNGRGQRVGLTTHTALRACTLAGSGKRILHEATAGLMQRDATASARTGLWLWQAFALVWCLGILLGLVGIAGASPRLLLTMLLTVPFLTVVLIRAALLLAYPLARPRYSAAASPRLNARDLPVYTLLVPLYREARMLPGLIRALNALDYPRAKLDIKLILESVDGETIAAAKRLGLGPPFDLVIVPDGEPRSKPKALNFALALAKGDYVGVYDAEDVPQPDQLRGVLAAFASGPADLGCVQGQLMIDNASDGWLCRQFALEYLTHFDGVLPALDRLGFPLPLGGTSNHFPLGVLRQIGGWDAWNVTEDADLGLRLVRRGFGTQLIATTTHEEAPHQWGNWLRQRTRWFKGWMQTYMVHSRRPWRQFRDHGAWGWLGVQAMFGGTILSSLLYPYSLTLLIVQTALGWPLIDTLAWHAAPLIVLALISLLGGLAIALAHPLVCAIGRGRWGLVPQVALLPVYWLLISLAAHRAVVQVAIEPFKWEKTEHGLGRKRGGAKPGQRLAPSRSGAAKHRRSRRG